jgi:lipid-A-disaccharide synthase-like uncharacterized protein
MPKTVSATPPNRKSLRRWLRLLGLGWLALFGSVWVAIWFVVAEASESNSKLPFWYLPLVMGGTLAVGGIAYRVGRRSGSRVDSTFIALSVFAASLMIPPIALVLAAALS